MHTFQKKISKRKISQKKQNLRVAPRSFWKRLKWKSNECSALKNEKRKPKTENRKPADERIFPFSSSFRWMLMCFKTSKLRNFGTSDRRKAKSEKVRNEAKRSWPKRVLRVSNDNVRNEKKTVLTFFFFFFQPTIARVLHRYGRGPVHCSQGMILNKK